MLRWVDLSLYVSQDCEYIIIFLHSVQNSPLPTLLNTRNNLGAAVTGSSPLSARCSVLQRFWPRPWVPSCFTCACMPAAGLLANFCLVCLHLPVPDSAVRPLLSAMNFLICSCLFVRVRVFRDCVNGLCLERVSLMIAVFFWVGGKFLEKSFPDKGYLTMQ